MTPDEHFASMTDAEKDAAIATYEANWLSQNAMQYLRNTDWYTSRKAETGTAIPEDVSAARAAARLAITSN